MADDIKSGYLHGTAGRRLHSGRTSPSRCSRPGLPRRRPASPTIPKPWRWRRSMPTACPTCAWCCSRASMARTRGPRLRLLHQHRERQGPRDPAAGQGGALLPLEEPAPPGARARPSAPVTTAEADAYFASRARGSRHRRLGLAAVAPAGKPLRAGEGGGAVDGPLSYRRNPAPALLVGLSHHAARDRVLARPTVPPARPGRVPRGARGGLGKERLYPEPCGRSTAWPALWGMADMVGFDPDNRERQQANSCPSHPMPKARR